MSDSIKRQAAIDTVHRMREILDTDNIDDYEELLAEALAQLTPQLKDPDSTDFSDGFAMGYKAGQDDALQEKQWIPCSERLPEEYGEYRITWVTSYAPSKRFIGDSEYEITSVWDEERKEFKGEWLLDEYIRHYPDVKVIAWKPLEEPYRECEE